MNVLIRQREEIWRSRCSLQINTILSTVKYSSNVMKDFLPLALEECPKAIVPSEVQPGDTRIDHSLTFYSLFNQRASCIDAFYKDFFKENKHI